MSARRLLIVDDEPLARDRVRTLLRDAPSIEIVGECADGAQALALIRQDRPDVVLLDVQLPRCSGLQVAEQLSPEECPILVFITAHERFAIDAFRLHAADYLLKPFDRERLLLALQRALEQVALRHSGTLHAELESRLVADGPGRLAFRSEGRIVFLEPREIIWVEAVGNYVSLHLADMSRLMLRDTLSAVEERLGTTEFARINRSAVVRLDQLKELQPTLHGDYHIVLRDGTKLPLSRQHRSRLGVFNAEET